MRLGTAIGICILLAACTGGAGQDLPEITRTEVEVQLPPEASPPVRVPIESISSDVPKNSVTARYYSGTPSCYSLARVEVGYRADRIEVEVFESRIVGEEAVCTQELVGRAVTVALSQPISGREVVIA